MLAFTPMGGDPQGDSHHGPLSEDKPEEGPFSCVQPLA